MIRIARVLASLLIAGSVAWIAAGVVGSIGRAVMPGANHGSWQSLVVLLFEFVAFIVIVPPVYDSLVRAPDRTSTGP